MEKYQKAPLANFVLTLVLNVGGITAWFVYVHAAWYVHVIAVLCILQLCWFLVEKILSRWVNRFFSPF